MTEKNIDELLERKMEQGREYRNMTEIRAEETDEEMIVRGYATTFDAPYLLWSEPGYEVYEIIDRHAIDKADRGDVILQYDHAGRVFARTGNGTLTETPDDHGYAIEAKLGGTDIGKQLYQEIAGGYTTKMSWGFRVAKDKREIVEDEATGMVTVTRTILEVAKVYDVSAVSLPANDATEISARSYGEGVIAEIREEIAKAEAEQEKRRKQIEQIKILVEA